MPVYEYKYKDCNKICEILVFSSDETPECTHCGSTNLEKLVSRFGLSLGPMSTIKPARK